MEENKELILIIESDDFFRNLIAEKLKERGYQVSEAKDGTEGLKKIKIEKPDLVFLNMILNNEKEEGIITLGTIKIDLKKEDPALSSIPVVVLSNLGEPEEINTALELGADDYLIKVNSTPELFVKRIKGILN